MTSLIDVIFLLLLFFMLSSTFSKFAEVELSSAVSNAPATSDTPPLFLELGRDTVRLNGASLTLPDLTTSLAAQAREDDPVPLLVSLKDGVNAQRLTDLLVVLRGLNGVQAVVLGGT